MGWSEISRAIWGNRSRWAVLLAHKLIIYANDLLVLLQKYPTVCPATREELMPHFWKNFVPSGVLYGDPISKGHVFHCSNRHMLSLPAYQSIMVWQPPYIPTGEQFHTCAVHSQSLAHHVNPNLTAHAHYHSKRRESRNQQRIIKAATLKWRHYQSTLLDLCILNPTRFVIELVIYMIEGGNCVIGGLRSGCT